MNDRALLSSKGASKGTKSVTHAKSISTSEIRAELERILSSKIFATADRMKRFLRFVSSRKPLKAEVITLTNHSWALKSMIGVRNSILEWTRLSAWMPGDGVAALSALRGVFTEVVPHRKVAVTWGWESKDPSLAALKPGESLVEIELEPREGGTLVRLRHSRLPKDISEIHADRWS